MGYGERALVLRRAITSLHPPLAMAVVEVTTRGVNKTFLGWRWCPCNKACGVVNALRLPVGFDSPPTHKGTRPLTAKRDPALQIVPINARGLISTDQMERSLQ